VHAVSGPIGIFTHHCPVCGQPVEEEGPCPMCRQGRGKAGEQGGGGQWTDCAPAMPDCDCPIIGYAKFHLPGCKYF
jgi:hypothetical protein